jgi:hypothetical protein
LDRKNNFGGIEKFLIELSKEYEILNTDIELIIAFWEVVPHIPPLPSKEREIIIN